ncbi:unnamed protein product [Paramecium sonneborni]|uniref:Uncharacterized protein n=1 Tax=Paramecium sonneborni TaxID=65129 RepID=A0A8S1MZ46_9CILI|nr:unnamed protein product [Paramecium sonneborni]
MLKEPNIHIVNKKKFQKQIRQLFCNFKRVKQKELRRKLISIYVINNKQQIIIRIVKKQDECQNDFQIIIHKYYNLQDHFKQRMKFQIIPIYVQYLLRTKLQLKLR